MSTATIFLEILQVALATLSAIPATAPEAVLGGVLVTIIQKAMAGYAAAAGAPLDLSKIPIETKVP
jgi:hypothetical protein